jgi:hypothetical protein
LGEEGVERESVGGKGKKVDKIQKRKKSFIRGGMRGFNEEDRGEASSDKSGKSTERKGGRGWGERGEAFSTFKRKGKIRRGSIFLMVWNL